MDLILGFRAYILGNVELEEKTEVGTKKGGNNKMKTEIMWSCVKLVNCHIVFHGLKVYKYIKWYIYINLTIKNNI